MEKIALAVLLLASCAEPPPPPKHAAPVPKAEPMTAGPEAEPAPSPPSRPMTEPAWKGVEAKKLSKAADSGGSPLTIIQDPGFEAPPPKPTSGPLPPGVGAASPAWSSSILPERDTAQYLAPRERQVWAVYETMPAARRTAQAFSDAISETHEMCRTETECNAHQTMVLAYAIQGRHRGSYLIQEEGVRWVLTVGGKDACMARFGELRADALVRDHTAGLFCATLAKSTVTGKAIFRDQTWTPW